MKTYEIILKPLSGFGTPLKGDTIFGQICWQAAYDPSLFNRSINELLFDYDKNPFLVVSSVFFRLNKAKAVFRFFKRPDMPLADLFDLEGERKKEIIKQRKELKTKRWMKLGDTEQIKTIKDCVFISDKELLHDIFVSLDEKSRRETGKMIDNYLFTNISQPHNSINRLTHTTGEGRFAPFTTNQNIYHHQAELAIFIGLAEGITIEQVNKALEMIGETGFGRDASIGLGKFKVVEIAEIDLFAFGSDKANACYTLAPSIPEQGLYRQMYFTPFTRFGRHGDVLAKSSNPFKSPVIMADEGAVLLPEKMSDTLRRPYVGTSITGISKVEPKTVMQGYSLYVPMRVEVQ